MTFKIQAEGFFAIGDLPIDEHHRCLLCRKAPDRVHEDLFVLERCDIPASIASRIPNILVVQYRLCPNCDKAKPAPWKIRLLLLERLKEAV